MSSWGLGILVSAPGESDEKGANDTHSGRKERGAHGHHKEGKPLEAQSSTFPVILFFCRSPLTKFGWLQVAVANRRDGLECEVKTFEARLSAPMSVKHDLHIALGGGSYNETSKNKERTKEDKKPDQLVGPRLDLIEVYGELL